MTHVAGQMSCGAMELSFPDKSPESAIPELLDGGRTLIGAGLEDAQAVSIFMYANPTINGRYTGSFEGGEQGLSVTINYFW